MIQRPGLLFFLAAFASAAAFVPRAAAEIEHVIAISVDGLRGDFLQTFVDAAPADFPNFVALRDASAFTYNARCDYDFSETVPNHLSMITGRPVQRPAGASAIEQGFSANFPTATDTVHASGSNAGVYKAGIFDVVHDHGLSTSLFLGKTRLEIARRSYDAAHGAPDLTGADNGPAKIDFSSVQDGGTPALIAALLQRLQTSRDHFVFLHVVDPDTAGHSGGWITDAGSAYRNSIVATDGYVGQIMAGVQSDPALAGKTAIILTGDHGGGGDPANARAHTAPALQGNYTVPFFLLAPGIPAGSDLYALFENRFNPGAGRPDYLSEAQPVRNGDIANLSAFLLGLPSVPDSFMKPELKKPLRVVRSDGVLSVIWPRYLTGWTLEFTDALPAADWQTVTAAIPEVGNDFVFTVEDAPAQRFFRLRRPASAIATRATERNQRALKRDERKKQKKASSERSRRREHRRARGL